MTDYLSVRSNFVLGPLVLKVEKSFGRGAKRETKRATATTTQMIGRINLRVVGNNVTLHSIKVQQPKQVLCIFPVFVLFQFNLRQFYNENYFSLKV